jgi:hypothetical protein
MEAKEKGGEEDQIPKAAKEKSAVYMDQWSSGLMTGVEKEKEELTTWVDLRGARESFCAVRTGRRTGLALYRAV